MAPSTSWTQEAEPDAQPDLDVRGRERRAAFVGAALAQLRQQRTGAGAARGGFAFGRPQPLLEGSRSRPLFAQVVPQAKYQSVLFRFRQRFEDRLAQRALHATSPPLAIWKIRSARSARRRLWVTMRSVIRDRD